MCRYAVGLWTAPPDDDAGERGLLLGSHPHGQAGSEPAARLVGLHGRQLRSPPFRPGPGRRLTTASVC